MKRSAAILMMSASLCVAGCNPTTIGLAASPLFAPKEDVNVLNASYAAADELHMRTIQRFPKSRTLVIETLSELVDETKTRPDKSVITNPKVGMLIADQLEQRFIQLGYNVQPKEASAQGKVVGIYEAVGRKLAVRIRLKDEKTGVMIGQYDYWLPITPSIRKYMDEYSGGIPLYKVREGFNQLID